MLIAFDSLTGNVERFVRKLAGAPSSVRIKEGLIIAEKFVLITYTTGFGEIPSTTATFLDNNHGNLMGVAASGNRNWGVSQFAKSGRLIAEKYNVPLILQFELSGNPKDLITFTEGARQLYATH